MKLTIPELSLVVLIGPSGCGKSTFAAKHFRATEVISSDHCRALVADDENDMGATPAAFRILHSIARERLRSGRIAVVDATSVQPESRKPLVALAGKRVAHGINGLTNGSLDDAQVKAQALSRAAELGFSGKGGAR